jgi:hypothetical protein
MKDRMKSKKVVAPLWCVDVHSSDYTRLALKDLQLKTYLNRVLMTAGPSQLASLKKSPGKSPGIIGRKSKKKANYKDGHASWVEVDRNFHGIQVKALATGVPAPSMRTALSKEAFQQGLSYCAFPKLPQSQEYDSNTAVNNDSNTTVNNDSNTAVSNDSKLVQVSSASSLKNAIGFHFRFCGKSLTYPLSSAGCLKDKVSGLSCLAFAEKGVTTVTTVTTVTKVTRELQQLQQLQQYRWMAKSSMASAGANFVLRDLSLMFHPHAQRQSPAAIFAKKLEELKSDSGVWGASVIDAKTSVRKATKTSVTDLRQSTDVMHEEVRGMKGVGLLSRVPTFARPLLGARFSVSGRLNGKDMASTVWASGGKLPRSWVSPKVNEDNCRNNRNSNLKSSCFLSEKSEKMSVIDAKTSVRALSKKAAMARLRSGGGLSYAAGTVATRYGSLGLKVWLFF